ncbi:MAG TPA: Asp-tRNA(Asn)/Glu-tRNA(Gln) amidotransferase subunit GatB [Candidatus Limnocylindrales bacterium]
MASAMSAAVRSRPDRVLERWEPVIGIEVHTQLRTASKMFCACSTAYDGAPPNSHCCPVCLGLPGALPTINRRAVELVVATGVAIEATTPERTVWERKNYFYPDLPKGYQISQYLIPLAADGRLTFDTSEGPVTIRIRRAHLEEDTAKLIHATDGAGRRVSLVDFNRSGAPLMEIVTEADVRSAEQARRYAEELQLLLRSIGVSDADMERGQMRVEANVSLRERGTEPFGTRVEVKNMNSFRSVERAVAFEIARQAAALETGEPLVQETRGWNEDRGETYVMRLKEMSEDYRYFPEPDLPPLVVDRTWLDGIAGTLPELPAARRRRFVEALGIAPADAVTLVAEPAAGAVFEAALAAAAPAREAANWVTGEYLRLARKYGEGEVPHLEPARIGAQLAELITLVLGGELTRTNAKEAFESFVASGRPVGEIVAERGLRSISDADAIRGVVNEVLASNPAAVADYRAGKGQAIGFLVGQVMKATGGRANAGTVSAAIRQRLETGG